MISKAQIKFINSLKTKKYRQKYHLFLSEGKKLAKELLNGPIEKDSIFATQNWVKSNAMDAQRYDDILNEVSEPELKKISSLSTPNEILVVAKIPQDSPDPSEINTSLSLALDNIQDPGNMGTIIRIADWFNIPYIFCSKDCVDMYNPKVVQATMGSIGRVKVYYRELSKLFIEYSSLPVYGATIHSTSIYDCDRSGEGFILMGSESLGINEQLNEFISTQISIPKYGAAESLNVAMAAAIICAEFRKGN